MALIITYIADKFYTVKVWSEPTYQSHALFHQNNHNSGWMLMTYAVLINYDFISGMIYENIGEANILYTIGSLLSLTLATIYFALSHFVDVS